MGGNAASGGVVLPRLFFDTGVEVMDVEELVTSERVILIVSGGEVCSSEALLISVACGYGASKVHVS
jgi:hypothetical protein